MCVQKSLWRPTGGPVAGVNCFDPQKNLLLEQDLKYAEAEAIHEQSVGVTDATAVTSLTFEGPGFCPSAKSRKRIQKLNTRKKAGEKYKDGESPLPMYRIPTAL